MDERLVFVNIGWMVSYQGDANDPTLGGHGYLQTHDLGHEAWNFLPTAGRVYGYVPRSATIQLHRLGAPRRADSLDDVTVVWLARSPQSRRTYVVGWYRGATINRANDHYVVGRRRVGDVRYQITAPAERAKLLPPDQRTLRVPTKKVQGSMGQSPVWYGNPEFLARVRDYLKHDGVQATSGAKNKKKGGAAKQTDPELRKLVELAAVRHAIEHYTSEAGGSRTVESVEGDNVGWDLNVTGGDMPLKVEVKGLSGTNLCVELTPNEYAKMRAAEHRAMYVVYIVTESLTKPVSHVFYYNAEASKGINHIWSTHDGTALKVEPILGARLTLKS